MLACSNPSSTEPQHTYVDVVAGDSHTCALSSAGKAFCWGYNEGRWHEGSWLSDPPAGSRVAGKSLSTDVVGSLSDQDWTRPRAVDGDPGLSAIVAAGGFSCGLSESGMAYCWGRNERGQLGDGSTSFERFRAEPVVGEFEFSALAALTASVHACAIERSGRAYCWGNNWRRQLGAGLEVDSLYLSVPTPVAGNQTFAMLAAGPGETCGLTTTSDLYCWGADGSGLRDDDRRNDRGAPVLIATSVRLDTLGVGSAVTCGLVDGSAYCRGWNGNGVLGTGDTVSRAAFTLVATDLQFDAISVGRVHVCAVTGAGTAYCWGWGDSGRLGNGSTETRLTPTPVAGEHVFRKVSAGGNHTCALNVAGEIWCWGSGFYGQLGTGNREDSAVPVQIAPPID